MNNIYLTKSVKETQALGKILAGILRENSRKSRNKRALVVGLSGDLGGGKTAFAQGFAKGLEIKQKIASPTYVILKKYAIGGRKRKKNEKKAGGLEFFYHIDCYRLKGPGDLESLGFGKISADPGNVVLMEWAEIAKDALPKKMIWVEFEFVDKTTRRIAVRLP